MRTRKTDIQKAIIYISRNISKELDLKKIAAEANMSEFHFYRLFKNEMGTTPQKYIEELRLEQAIHVLTLQPHIKKINLAFESGYNSPSSFNRAFKNYFGFSPSAYLKDRANNVDAVVVAEGIAALDLVYLNTIKLKTTLIVPDYPSIEKFLLDSKDRFTSATPIYGIFLDAPFHKPPASCRYLIGGVEADTTEVNYQIDNGYYSRVKISGSLEQSLEQVFDNYNLLTKCGYYIRSPIGFEKFYFQEGNKLEQIQKEIFIPIAKK